MAGWISRNTRFIHHIWFISLVYLFLFFYYKVTWIFIISLIWNRSIKFVPNRPHIILRFDSQIWFSTESTPYLFHIFINSINLIKTALANFLFFIDFTFTFLHDIRKSNFGFALFILYFFFYVSRYNIIKKICDLLFYTFPYFPLNSKQTYTRFKNYKTFCDCLSVQYHSNAYFS